MSRLPTYSSWAVRIALASTLLLQGCATVSWAPPEQNDAAPDRQEKNGVVWQKITPQLIQELASARDHTAGLRPLLAEPEPYRIGNGDVLAIQLLNIGGSTKADSENGAQKGEEYVVANDGRIQFPYLDRITVAGKTEVEIRSDLKNKLTRFYARPELTVKVIGYNSKRIYLQGAAGEAGIVPIQNIAASLPRVLVRAGGLAPTADQTRISLSRKGKRYEINYPALVDANFPVEKIILQDQDTLSIPSRSNQKIYIAGYVTSPQTLTVNEDGTLSLLDAINKSFGIAQFTGDPKNVYVIRSQKDTKEGAVIYQLDASKPSTLLSSANFALQPKDFVYIDGTRLATWNRVINLILPSASFLTTTTTIANESK